MNGEPATCDGKHTTGLNVRYVGTTSDGQHGRKRRQPKLGEDADERRRWRHGRVAIAL